LANVDHFKKFFRGKMPNEYLNDATYLMTFLQWIRLRKFMYHVLRSSRRYARENTALLSHALDSDMIVHRKTL